MTCALCEVNAADVEAVLFPTRVDALFPMMMRHADDTEAWPSMPLCDACDELTGAVFRTLTEDLSVGALCALTCDDLIVLVRLAVAAERAPDV